MGFCIFAPYQLLNVRVLYSGRYSVKANGRPPGAGRLDEHGDKVLRRRCWLSILCWLAYPNLWFSFCWLANLWFRLARQVDGG